MPTHSFPDLNKTPVSVVKSIQDCAKVLGILQAPWVQYYKTDFAKTQLL